MYTNVHNRDESHTHTQLPISVYSTHNNNMRYVIVKACVQVYYRIYQYDASGRVAKNSTQK